MEEVKVPKINFKTRAKDIKNLTGFMKGAKDWQIKAITNIGFERWTKLHDNFAKEDLELLYMLVKNVDCKKNQLRIYDRVYQLDSGLFREYLGLNDGDETYDRTTTVSDARVELLREEYVGKYKANSSDAISGAKCVQQLQKLLLIEKPTPEQFLKFQLTWFWTLLVDVLVPSSTRFTSLHFLHLDSAEQIRNTDWADLAFDFMMERISAWQGRLVGKKSDNPIVVSDGEECHDKMAAGNKAGGKKAGGKKRERTGQTKKARKSKKAGEHDGPSKTCSTSGTTDEVEATDGGDGTSGEGNDRAIVAIDGAIVGATDRADGTKDGDSMATVGAASVPLKSKGKSAGQENRMSCGGFVFFLQLFYYEHVKASTIVPVADFPLQRWTLSNQIKISRVLKGGSNRKYINHPQVFKPTIPFGVANCGFSVCCVLVDMLKSQELLGEDGWDVPEDEVNALVKAEFTEGNASTRTLDEVVAKVDEVQKTCMAKLEEFRTQLVFVQKVFNEMPSTGAATGTNLAETSDGGVYSRLTADELAAKHQVETWVRLKMVEHKKEYQDGVDLLARKFQELKVAVDRDAKNRENDSLAALREKSLAKKKKQKEKEKAEMEKDVKIDEANKAVAESKAKIESLEKTLVTVLGKMEAMQTQLNGFRDRWGVVERRLNVDPARHVKDNPALVAYSELFNCESTREASVVIAEPNKAVSAAEGQQEVSGRVDRQPPEELDVVMVVGKEIETEAGDLPIPSLLKSPKLQTQARLWPEIEISNPFLKAVVYFIYENNSDLQMTEPLMPSPRIGGEWFPFFLQVFNGCGGTEQYENQAIDLIGQKFINSKRKTGTDALYIPVDFSNNCKRLMAGQIEATDFKKDQLESRWSRMEACHELYFPLHQVDHFMLVYVSKKKQTLELWDTLSNNRAGHIKYLQSILKKLKPLLNELDESADKRNNWAKFKVVSAQPVPIQEVGKNDCGAWVATFMIDGLEKWRVQREDQPGSQQLRFRVLCELLRKENWDGEHYTKLIQDAMRWALTPDDLNHDVMKKQ